MLQSLQIKISHGNLDRCSVTRSGKGSPLPHIADPYLSCCGFDLARSHSSEDFRLCLAEKWQPALCCGRHRDEPAPSTGHLLGRETSAHRLHAWPRAQGQAHVASDASSRRYCLCPVCKQGAPASRDSASTALNGSKSKQQARGFQDTLFSSITNIAYKPGPNFDNSCRNSPGKSLSLSCCCL